MQVGVLATLPLLMAVMDGPLSEERWQQIEGGRTRLDIHASFRVTTSFNRYAVAVADFLGGDFVDGLLTLYKRRSEA